MPEEAPESYFSMASNILICMFALCVALAVSHLIQEGWRVVVDMKEAMEFERPIRTRSDLEQLPVVGSAFSMACDLQDFVWFNSTMVGKYVGTIPFLVALPTTVGAVSSMWSLKKSATAVFFATSSMLRQ